MSAFVQSWFWTFLQFIVVLATLVMIYRQVKTQTASHIVSTINSINDRWNSDLVLKARYSFCQKWLDGNKEFDAVGELIAEVLEEVGTIVRIRAVPKKVIWETHSWYIEHYYHMFKEGIETVRDECNDQTLYSEFQWLCAEMQKIDRQKQSPYVAKTTDELHTFASGEFEISRVAIFLKEDGIREKYANKANPADAPKARAAD